MSLLLRLRKTGPGTDTAPRMESGFGTNARSRVQLRSAVQKLTDAQLEDTAPGKDIRFTWMLHGGSSRFYSRAIAVLKKA